MSTYVPPFVLTGKRNKGTYRVTPQERFDAWAQAVVGSQLVRTDPIVSAPRSVDGGKTYATIDVKPRFFPVELPYPGGDTTMFELIAGKYVYVVHRRDKVFLLEMLVNGTTCRYRLKPQPAEQGSNPELTLEKTLNMFAPEGWMDVPYKPGDKTDDFGFFLTPIRLSQRGMEELLKTLDSPDKLDTPGEPFVLAKWFLPTAESTDAVLGVAMPDPLRWAGDAHDDYYIPLLDAFEAWVGDAERQAELFVASTLKSWMENGDPLGVANELEKDPENYISYFRFQEQGKRDDTEAACAYVAHCKDCPEWRVIELSAIDHAKAPFPIHGDSVALMWQAKAAVLDRMTSMRAGKMLAVRQVRDMQLMPREFLFQIGQTQSYSVGLGRYTWQAILQIFDRLYPAFEHFEIKALLPSAGGVEADLAQMMFKQIMVPTDKMQFDLLLVQQQKKFPGRLGADGKPLQSISMRTMRKMGYEKLVPQPIAEPPLGLGMRYKRFRVRYFFDIVSMCFEVVNLANAIQAYRDASPGTSTDKLISLIGASGDMANFLASFAERVAKQKENPAGALIAQRAGYFAGIIGGICEFKDDLDKTMPAVDQRNYGEAVGYGLATAGAATVAIASGLSLGWTLAAIGTTAGAASAAAPPAAPFIIVGAAMIAVGATLAWALTRNEYEKYAVRSMFGKDRTSPPDYFPWSPSPLPTGLPVKEAATVICLISNFKVVITGSGDPRNANPDGTPNAGVTISTGYMPPDSILQVEIEQVYGPTSYKARLYLYETGDGFAYVSGNMMPRLSDAVITADGDGKIRKVSLPLQPLSMNVGTGAVLFANFTNPQAMRSSHVRVRLEAGGLSVPGPNRTSWLDLDTLSDKSVNSLDSSKWNPPP